MNRYKCVLLLMCVSLTLAQANSEQPDTAFVTKVEGIGRLIDAIQTPQGYVSISKKDVAYPPTFVIRKTSNSGARVWEKEFSSGFQYLSGLASTVDGYVFAGWQEPDSYYYDYGVRNSGFIFKLNNNGTLEWSKNFILGNTATTLAFDSVESRPDGGFVVVGHTANPNNSVVTSFTANGDVLWSKSFEGLSRSYFSHRATDGLILVGVNGRILKINDSGHIDWKRRIFIGSRPLLGRTISSISSTADNGIILVLRNSNLVLVQLNANGKIEWTETYALNVYSFVSSSLAQTVDGGYVISGTKMNDGGGSVDGVLLKINARHDVVFLKAFGDPGIQETGSSVFAKNGGGYVLFGSSGPRDTLLLSVNSNGVVPECNFFKNLIISKLGSASVTSESVDIVAENFSFPTPSTFTILLSDSETSSSSSCP